MSGLQLRRLTSSCIHHRSPPHTPPHPLPPVRDSVQRCAVFGGAAAARAAGPGRGLRSGANLGTHPAGDHSPAAARTAPTNKHVHSVGARCTWKSAHVVNRPSPPLSPPLPVIRTVPSALNPPATYRADVIPRWPTPVPVCGPSRRPCTPTMPRTTTGTMAKTSRRRRSHVRHHLRVFVRVCGALYDSKGNGRSTKANPNQ